jgi:hypothetical protein
VAERAVGLDRDPEAPRRLDRGIGEVRVQLDLVDGRDDPGLLDDPVEVGGLKVGDARGAQPPVGDELGQGSPGGDERLTSSGA